MFRQPAADHQHVQATRGRPPGPGIASEGAQEARQRAEQGRACGMPLIMSRRSTPSITLRPAYLRHGTVRYIGGTVAASQGQRERGVDVWPVGPGAARGAGARRQGCRLPSPAALARPARERPARGQHPPTG